MPVVRFTSFLKRHMDLDQIEVTGATVAEVLQQVFAKHPQLRGYVLDDQGAVRKHVAVFADNETIRDRRTLTDRVNPDSEIYLMQALSGG